MTLGFYFVVHGRPASATFPTLITEGLRQQMLKSGQLLLAALEAEDELDAQCCADPKNDELIEHWKKARHEVERLAIQYTEEVDRYRRSLK